ncbi:SRPBCC family protein, partial [Accumulibacter sp.]|uniref:SRPBCC family protein n=1 Tax=Accumulibacter sp. TaxID=2053492 RepID=UPI0028C3C4DB
MQVLNIHEREISVSAAELGALLNSLSSASDALWPRLMWPPMRFDRPLGVGASGGHGPVRYAVEEFSPGRVVKFRFSGPSGFNGIHQLEVLPKREDCTVLRHTLDMKAQGAALLSWPLVFRPLHDALLEDSLALAQAAFGAVPQVRPWSPWV